MGGRKTLPAAELSVQRAAAHGHHNQSAAGPERAHLGCTEPGAADSVAPARWRPVYGVRYRRAAIQPTSTHASNVATPFHQPRMSTFGFLIALGVLWPTPTSASRWTSSSCCVSHWPSCWAESSG